MNEGEMIMAIEKRFFDDVDWAEHYHAQLLKNTESNGLLFIRSGLWLMALSSVFLS